MAAIRAEISDSPYRFERRLSATEIVLRYGETETLERWRAEGERSITMSAYLLKVRGRWYRFAGQYRPAPRRRRAAAAFLLCLALGGAANELRAQAPAAGMPLATQDLEETAPLAISLDGRTVTFRTPANDTLRVCVEPRAGRSAMVRCYTLGELREGRR